MDYQFYIPLFRNRDAQETRNNTREHRKAPTKRRQHQQQKAMVGRQMVPEHMQTNPLLERKKIQFDRGERLRKTLPVHYPAYGNLTPFGPPVERTLLRKYMFEDQRVYVTPIDEYLTVKTALKFTMFGTYFRTFYLNDHPKKVFACFFNWDNATTYYGLQCRQDIKTM